MNAYIFHLHSLLLFLVFLFCREGIGLAGVEVRFENLTVEADCFVGERALPTLPNAVRNIAEAALSCFGVKLQAERAKLHILKDISGIIKPSRCVCCLCLLYIYVY